MRHIPKKRFVQNFLVDDNVTANIVELIAPHNQDLFLEIGPGKGALTDILAKHCEALTAIEIDRDLFTFLKEKYKKAVSI